MDCEAVAVEDGVGELGNPFAEDDEAAGGREGLVGQDVAVAHHEIVYGGVDVAEVFYGEYGLRLGVDAEESGDVAAVVLAVFCAPPVGEAYGPPGMYGGVETLAESVAEQAADEAESGAEAADAVAVGEEEFLAHNLAHGISVDYFHAYFVAQVVEHPYVVVADEPMDFYASVGQAGKSAKEPDIATRHDGAVFIPIVEDVAEEVDFGGGAGYGVEEAHDAALGFVPGAEVLRSEVQVAQKVYFFFGQVLVFKVIKDFKDFKDLKSRW